MSSKPLRLECRHGVLASTVVCRHHVTAQERVVGFIEISDDPHDLGAWCDECEAFFEREGERTEAFDRFNDFALVCVACYSELKARHSRGLEDPGPWPFSDPKDLAVFTVDAVLTGQQPALEVHHQVFDGSLLQKFGLENGFQRLSQAIWDATQADAWEMTHVACLLLQSDGVYRAPDEDGALFMVLSEPELVEK
jgi:hypothetical protein